jgi:hypothetical protein
VAVGFDPHGLCDVRSPLAGIRSLVPVMDGLVGDRMRRRQMKKIRPVMHNSSRSNAAPSAAPNKTGSGKSR